MHLITFLQYTHMEEMQNMLSNEELRKIMIDWYVKGGMERSEAEKYYRFQEDFHEWYEKSKGLDCGSMRGSS